MKIRFFAALCLSVVSLLAAPAHSAPNPYSIKVKVNDTALSVYDFEQHRKLHKLFGDEVLSDAALLDDLINQTLKTQAGQQLGEILPSALQEEVANFVAGRGFSEQSFTAALSNAGLDRSTVEAFLASELMWRETMRGQFLAQTRPSADEVTMLFAQRAAQPAREVLLAELSLSVFAYPPEQLRALAESLSAQFAQGADFAAAVRKYSQGHNASGGGELGWFRPENLPAPFNALATRLAKGEVSPPFGIDNGASFLKVVDERPVPSSTAQNISLSYVTLPVASNAPEAEILALRSDIRDCSGDLPANAVRSDDVVLAEAPLALMDLLSVQPVGLMTEPVNGNMYLVCSREIDLPADIRQRISNSITSQRIGVLADGYLTELRDAAIIEHP